MQYLILHSIRSLWAGNANCRQCRYPSMPISIRAMHGWSPEHAMVEKRHWLQCPLPAVRTTRLAHREAKWGHMHSLYSNSSNCAVSELSMRKKINIPAIYLISCKAWSLAYSTLESHRNTLHSETTGRSPVHQTSGPDFASSAGTFATS